MNDLVLDLESAKEVPCCALGCELSVKMFALQGDVMKLGVLKKDTNNPHLSSRYLSFTAIQLALMPLWRKHNLLIKFNSEYRLESTFVSLSITDMDSGMRESHSHEVKIEPRKGTSRVQWHGADESYCKRYLIKTVFWIVDSEDDRNESYLVPSEDKPQAEPEPAKDTPDGAAIKMHLASPLFQDHDEDAQRFREAATEAWKAKDSEGVKIVRTEIERYLAVLASGRK